MLILIILAIITIVILVVAEMTSHDCIENKREKGYCNHSVPSPTPDDDDLTYVDKVIEMVKNNYEFVSWRQAFIVAIIAPVPIIYYLKGRLPEFFEWVVIGVLVFLFTYLSSSWMFAHFFLPNGNAMEKSLMQLRDRLQDRM